MNIHHLELFYYVARHGGISSAARLMPYGIQQPAVSSQILLLEQDLGVKLFDRQPFRLTAEGELLYTFVRTFFDKVEAVGTHLRRRTAPQIRIGASELILRDHLPPVFQKLRQDHPNIRLGLRAGYPSQLESWLQDRQIDLAVVNAAPQARPPVRLQRLRLVRVPLVLLVHRKSKIKTAAELWAQSRIAESLISLPEQESISRLFQKGLKRRGVEWPSGIEASSLELITQYVANGYGIGVNVNLPEAVKHPQVRMLPLDGFDPMEIVVLWQGPPTPVIRTVLEVAQSHVQQLWPQWCCHDKVKSPA